MSLETAAIATNRFGLGARVGELTKIAGDPRGWLLAQLEPEKTLPAPIAALPSTAQASRQFPRFLESLGLTGQPGALAKLYTGARKTADGGGAMSSAAPEGSKLSVEQSYIEFFAQDFIRAVEARFEVATNTDRPFFERLCRFWANHFTVSAAKPDVIALVAVFERDVVRPRVCGPFEDMLLASCRHPGMLTYLDNHLSIGPDSPLAHHPEFLPPYLRERMKGLNENLGREILELHTLGVRGGYTQADVTTLAKIITGWTIYGPAKIPPDGTVFHYVDYAHEPGPLTLLGHTYDQQGERQGEAALRDLARHPSTARHLAFKLARHFIADAPPEPAVTRIERAFRDSHGDLRATAAALVEAPEAWAAQPVKMKPPDDYVVSTVRALGGPPLKGGQLVALLERMGQRPYWAPGPDGWADIEDPWIGADAVWKRLEWASAIANGYAAANVDPVELAQAVLGPQLSAETREAMRLAENPSQGLALLLVSAEFQRR